MGRTPSKAFPGWLPFTWSTSELQETLSISQHHLTFVPLQPSLFCHQTQQCVHHHSLTILLFSSVHSLSCVWLFATPWTAAQQSSLSISNFWSLLKLMSIELVMPSNHLILCRPLLLPPSVFPSIRVFSNESVLLIRWPEYWSFSVSISPSNESFRIS